MRTSHTRTPRTLAECQWTAGYPSHHMPRRSLGERVADVVLAVILGVVGAALAVHWWTA